MHHGDDVGCTMVLLEAHGDGGCTMVMLGFAWMHRGDVGFAWMHLGDVGFWLYAPW
jgi:hypothetical protein